MEPGSPQAPPDSASTADSAQHGPVTVVFPAGQPRPDTQAQDGSASSGGTNDAQPGADAGRGWPKLAGFAVAALLLLAATNAATFAFAYRKGTSAAPSVQPLAADQPALTVPEGATIISQCAKKRGTQYVLPRNIPHGPVFNVYKGKVVGIEYMIGKDDLANNKDFLSIPLNNTAYDHMDIGLLSKGHAGYPEPHYHVDLYTITPAESSAITCES